MSSAAPRLEWLPIRGASMWPTLRAGDEAALSAPMPPPSPGDVVVARVGDALVVHRLRRRDPGGALILRGDACLFDDGPVRPEALLAVVRRVRRGGRILLRHEWDRPWLWPLSAALRLRQRAQRLVRRHR
jgi:signal peptidase I